MPIIRRNPQLRYCPAGYNTDACRVSRSQKSEPGCPGSPLAHPVGDWIRARVSHDAGIRTVSTTWITPFDWLTLRVLRGVWVGLDGRAAACAAVVSGRPAAPSAYDPPFWAAGGGEEGGRRRRPAKGGGGKWSKPFA